MPGCPHSAYRIFSNVRFDGVSMKHRANLSILSSVFFILSFGSGSNDEATKSLSDSTESAKGTVSGDENTINTAVAILKHRWRLAKAQDDAGNLIEVTPHPSNEFTVNFIDRPIGYGVFSGTNACNTFSGDGYELQDGVLITSRPFSTPISCFLDAEMKLVETIFRNILFSSTSMVAINNAGDELTLTSGAKEILFFEAESE